MAVVTDSTASLPPDLAAAAGLTVVPLHVVLDGAPPVDDAAARSADVARALRSGGRATTSQPSPEAFGRVYGALAESGASAIVSLHLSGELSGTVRSAGEGARGVGVPVDVVDTGTVALGTGFAALAAADLARRGADAAAVAAEARRVAAASCVVFAVQDLGYLHRGGRIGATKLLVGSVLGARPVLRVSDGRIGVAETVRGAGRATRRLAELVRESVGGFSGGPARVAVHHFDALDAAQELAGVVAALLDEAGLAHEPVVVAEVTAVVGVHTGPGVLGVVAAPAGPA